MGDWLWGETLGRANLHLTPCFLFLFLFFIFFFIFFWFVLLALWYERQYSL